MITKIEVSNYRSLGPNVRFELGRMTALVGPNGAGKSNVADVLRFVADALKVGLEGAIASRHGIEVVRRWSSGRPFNVQIRIHWGEGELKNRMGYYSFTLAGHSSNYYSVKGEEALVYNAELTDFFGFTVQDGKWIHGPSDLRPKLTQQSLAMKLVAGDERFAPLAQALRDVCIYSVFPDTLRKPQKPDTTRPMTQHGENWTSILQSLSSNGASSELTVALAHLTGDIRDFRVRQLGGYLNAEFFHHTVRKHAKQRQKWFESAQESDIRISLGTRRPYAE